MTERGRSLTEMLGTLAIVGILSVVGIWGYRHIVNSHDANTILHDINMMAHTCAAQLVMMDRTECALSDFSNKIDDKYPVSAQRVNQDYFKLVVSNIPQSICQELLNKGMPLASQIIPFTCVETNQFEWTFHKNLEGAVSTKFCHSDLDCNVCGVCQIADGQSQGICIGSCATPTHACETNEDCNQENECMVCNLEAHSCQDGCEKLEYLESTGAQYIDTGYVPTSTTLKYETHVYTPDMPTAEQDIVGYYILNGGGNVLGLYQKYVFNYTKEAPNPADVNTTSATFSGANDFYISAEANGDTLIKSLTVNGVTTTGTLRAKQTVFSNILLFKANPREKNYVGKMYYCKIYHNGTLIRDFIPVLSPESSQYSGEPCMFDKVTKKLFCNAGSGNFKTNKDE